MEILKTALYAIAILVAVMFAVLVFLTGKGDAMSGGSSVRTTFKGKASFDDFISKLTFILGISFMVLMVGIDIFERRTSEATTKLEPPSNSAPSNNNPAPKDKPPAPGATTGGATTTGTTSTTGQ